MQRPSTPTTKINIGANGAVTAAQTSAKVNAGNYGTAKGWGVWHSGTQAGVSANLQAAVTELLAVDAPPVTYRAALPGGYPQLTTLLINAVALQDETRL